jgi:hypothetical protein
MVKTKGSNVLLLLSAAGTVVMMYLMMISGSYLKTSATPHGIINLEFAYNKKKVEEIIHIWQYSPGKTDRITAAKENTYLDFIFLLFYSCFLFLTVRRLISGYRNVISQSELIAKGALLAGLFDILENLGMLQSLNGNISDPVALFTFISSLLKWLLVSAAILFIIFMLFYKLAKRNSLNP